MAKTNVWMSVSDLMTGLMVIFLFVSIAYMVRAQKLLQQRKQDFSEYVDIKKQLRDTLTDKFENKKDQVAVLHNDDYITLRFSKAETLFPRNESRLTPVFVQTLEEVIPDYMRVLLNDQLSKHIQEIRIEGHTDASPFGSTDSDPYLSNLKLSQDRSREVVACIRKICEKHFMRPEQEIIEAWLTAVGYSYTYALDDDGNYAAETKKRINPEKSRRVEIRVITDDYKVLKEIIER